MAVDQTVADILRAVTPQTVYVEVFNEVAQRQGSGLEQQADFMAAIVPKLHAHGLKVAGFSFSVGNPGSAEFGDKDDAQYLFNRGFCGVDAIAMHCYFGANTDAQQAWNRAYAFRYRAFHDAVPSCPPILLTECGVDAVPGGASGWKAAGLSGDGYVDLLRAFAAELDKDAYVLAAFPFTAGASVDWAAFDTDSLDLNRLYGGAAATFPDMLTKLEAIGLSEADATTALNDEALQAMLAGDGSADAIWTLLVQRYPQLNGGSSVIDTDVQKALDDINKRIADQTEGLRRVVEGHYGGATGAAGIVVELEGGATTISPQPDYAPKA